MNVEVVRAVYEHRPVDEVEPVADVLPAGEPKADEHTLLGLTELLLKHPKRVDALARDEGRQGDLIPRFLAVTLVAFGAFSLALVLMLAYVPHEAVPMVIRDRWTGGVGAGVSLWLAYTVGMIAASGVCLPSFYFFGLLAGVRASALQVTGHLMKGKASTAIMLLGILPIYVALGLGLIVFEAPAELLEVALYYGLALPFVAGLWGVWSIHRGFQGLADTLPACRRAHRACFLRRLTFAWSACYSVVTPVMIYTLWKFFADRLA
jgi:hypothetical protein